MRFYLDYTVCATPYLAHDTYLHGITVPSPSTQSDSLAMSDGCVGRSEFFTFGIV